jgi:signal transduction histidine kinase
LASRSVAGHPADELIGRNFIAYVQPEFLDSYRAAVVRVFDEARSSSLQINLQGVQTPVTYEVRLEPVKVGDTVAFALLLLTDMTARQRVEGALKQAYQDLGRLQAEIDQAQAQLAESKKLETIGRLSAGIAHQVKNPLAIVLQGIQYIAGHLPRENENFSLVLEAITEGIYRADGVVKDLLRFAAPTELRLKQAPLRPVIDDALQLVKYELDRAKIRVHRVVGEVPEVLMDADKIEQVLVNLFLNAIQAMSDGGQLFVRAKAVNESPHARGGPWLEVSVEDTGKGIAPEKLARLFDVNHMADKEDGGLSLGLFVTRQIMCKHRGEVILENRQEGGVRARLWLPIQPSPAG